MVEDVVDVNRITLGRPRLISCNSISEVMAPTEVLDEETGETKP